LIIQKEEKEKKEKKEEPREEYSFVSREIMPQTYLASILKATIKKVIILNYLLSLTYKIIADQGMHI